MPPKKSNSSSPSRSHSKKVTPAAQPESSTSIEAKTIPTPAKVAQPKKPTKSAIEQSQVAKKVVDIQERKTPSNEKLPYNFRTRSLARAIVDAVEEPDAKKAIRKTLKELRSFAEIKAAAVDIAGEEEFNGLLASWFDAGEIGQ